MANENGVSKGRVFLGSAMVIIVLGLLLALVFGVFTSDPVKKTKKVTAMQTQTKSWKKSVDKTLTNHEKRIRDLEGRMDKHADAISDLANSQLGTDKPIQEPKKEAEKPSKLKKYISKGWDYKDFPENW
jgi:uncharacterized protein HemX